MWPYVALSGGSHVIPSICPNCLAEAHEPAVCFHKDLVTCFLYPYLERLPKQAGLWIWLGAIAVVWWLIVRGYRRGQRQRHPKTEAQAVWGVATYYTAFSNYKAARPEWIEALVRCNPGTVKAKVYRRITGEEKPE